MSTPTEIVEINGLSVTRVESEGVVYQHVSTPAEIQLHNDLTALRARCEELERALANKHTIDDATHSEWEKANQTHCFKDNGDFAYRVKGEPK